MIYNNLTFNMDLFSPLAEISRIPFTLYKIDEVNLLPLINKVPGVTPRIYLMGIAGQMRQKSENRLICVEGTKRSQPGLTRSFD